MSALEHSSRAQRRATNVSISAEILAEARELKVNVSRAAEEGLTRAIAARRAEVWLEENKAAMESSNAYVEEHGLPLGKYRRF